MPEKNEFDLRYLSYNKWMLKAKYVFEVADKIIEIPENFTTDLASVPKILWNIFEPFGKHYTRAAVVHDYLYSKACKYKEITRAEADKIFLLIMKERGVPFWKRQLIYRAVRLFGKSHFRKE